MHTRFVIGVLAAALALAACSGSGSSPTSTLAEPATTAAAPTTTETAPTTTAAPRTTSTTTTVARSTTVPPATTTTTTTTTVPVATTSGGSSATSGGSSNAAPTVEITSPGGVARYEASYDPDQEAFGAYVGFDAAGADPDGDAVSIDWYSDGVYVGSGPSITVWLPTQGDVAQPTITAVATDANGASSQDSQQVIVWIVSDQ